MRRLPLTAGCAIASLLGGCLPGPPRLDCVAGCAEASVFVGIGTVQLLEGTAAAFEVTEDGEPYDDPPPISLTTDSPEILAVGRHTDQSFILVGVRSGHADLWLQVGASGARFQGIVLPR